MTKKATEIDAHVGRQIRLRRLVLGMSQDQLAAALGLTFQQVQKYEKGVNRVGAGRLFELSEILSVPVNYFYEGLPANRTNGGEHPGDRVAAFLQSEEGIRLSQAFVRIKPPMVRRRIFDLIGLLGGETEAQGSEEAA
jgi:transcriptional regulator with XRE-family HTH domain